MMKLELSPQVEKAISVAVASGNFPDAKTFIEAAIFNFLEEQGEKEAIEGWSVEELRGSVQQGMQSGFKPFDGMDSIIKL